MPCAAAAALGEGAAWAAAAWAAAAAACAAAVGLAKAGWIGREVAARVGAAFGEVTMAEAAMAAGFGSCERKCAPTLFDR